MGPRTDSRVLLVPRPSPVAARRPFGRYMLVALGLAVCFGVVTTRFSFDSILHDDSAKDALRHEQVLLAAVTTAPPGAAAAAGGAGGETSTTITITPAPSTSASDLANAASSASPTPEPSTTRPPPPATPEPTTSATMTPSVSVDAVGHPVATSTTSPSTTAPVPSSASPDPTPAATSSDNADGTSSTVPPATTAPCTLSPVGVDAFLDGENRLPVARFYAQWQRTRDAWGLAAATSPLVAESHRAMCAAKPADGAWEYCLPISGRQDEPYCAAADRRDLLIPQTRGTRCLASVLHLLLLDVVAVLDEITLEPALLHASMRSAVHNETLGSYAWSVDIGYKRRAGDAFALEIAREPLRRRGYHLFRDSIWRVCIAPTHPLAANLYDAERTSAASRSSVAHAALFALEPEEAGDATTATTLWRVEDATAQQLRVPADALAPYSKVRVNGQQLATVAQPAVLLDALGSRERVAAAAA